jgi:hypothetical protein
MAEAARRVWRGSRFLLLDTVYPPNESDEAGLHKGDGLGKVLGVVVVDINQDRRPEVYVANDAAANFLYINQSTPGMIRFSDRGLASGVAVGDRGMANGSKGGDAGDPEHWQADTLGDHRPD